MKASSQLIPPAIDAEHCRADIERITESLNREERLMMMAIKNKAATAASTHSGRVDALKRDLVLRSAELRKFAAVTFEDSIEAVVKEFCEAIGSSLPEQFVEQVYLAARHRLGVEEHLPSPPAHLWH